MEVFLDIPESTARIYPGTILRLGRFSDREWTAHFGWYSFGGNRPVCGWYLTDSCENIKPLQLPDLDDIYVIR